MNKTLLSLLLGLSVCSIGYADIQEVVVDETLETAVITEETDPTLIVDPTLIIDPTLITEEVITEEVITEEVITEEVITEEVITEEAALPEIDIQVSATNESITLEITLPVFDVEKIELAVVGDDQSPTKFLLGYEKVEESDVLAETEDAMVETKAVDEQEAEKPEGFILVLPDDIDPESMSVERAGNVLRVTFNLEFPEDDGNEIVDVLPAEEEELIVEEAEEDSEDDEGVEE